MVSGLYQTIKVKSSHLEEAAAAQRLRGIARLDQLCMVVDGHKTCRRTRSMTSMPIAPACCRAS